jgi:hypothetical protein
VIEDEGLYTYVTVKATLSSVEGYARAAIQQAEQALRTGRHGQVVAALEKAMTYTRTAQQLSALASNLKVKVGT